MNASIISPAGEAGAKPPETNNLPLFSTATFYEIKPPVVPGTLIEIGTPPTVAALAWDREHPYTPQPSTAEKSGKADWRRHIGSARLTWSKLSGGELERIEGDPAKLIVLLRRHYSFDLHEADRQVKSFFQRNRVQTTAS